MNRAHEPRLLIYSQDGSASATSGVRRCSRRSSSGRPGASALTVSDSPLGQYFTAAAGHDYCKLPSIRKVGPGDWRRCRCRRRSRTCSPSGRAMLRSAVESFRPDVMLVDHMPHGAMGELVPTLEALRDTPTVVVLGLRDILDAPAVVRERWRLEGALRGGRAGTTTGCWSTARRTSSTSPPSTTGRRAAVEGSSTAATSAHRLRPRWSSASGSGILSGTPDARLVVAMAGGGADAYRAVRRPAAAVPKIRPCRTLPRRRRHGPVPARERASELAPRAQGLPGRPVASVADPMQYLARGRPGRRDGGVQHHRGDPLRRDARRSSSRGRDRAPSSRCGRGCSPSAGGWTGCAPRP